MDAKEKDEKILYYLAKVVQDLALKNYTEIVKTIKELLGASSHVLDILKKES